MTTFFWSDLHLGEKSQFVGTAREKFTAAEWDGMILDALNSKVQVRDRLILAGDICESKRPGFWRQQIRCKNIMVIRGNHDAGPEKLQRVFGVGNVRDMYWTKIHGVYTVISHYQQLFWDRSHHGSYHLHGHLHDNRSEWTDKLIPGHRSLDIGPDSAYNIFREWRPFTERDIHDILSERSGHDHVQWYKDYQAQRTYE